MSRLIEPTGNSIPMPLSFTCGEALVIPVESDSRLTILNQSGRFIWEKLAAGASETDVATMIVNEFGLDWSDASGAVSTAISTWENSGLLRSTKEKCSEQRDSPDPMQCDPADIEDLSLHTYSLCGQPVVVGFSPPELEGIVRGRFKYSEVPTDRGSVPDLSLLQRNGTYLLYDGSALICESSSDEVVYGSFIRRFVEHNSQQRGWLSVLHAAALQTPDGCTFVLPGLNGAGKSVLSASLLEAGFSYFSDDCVPINNQGHIVPVPFAISIKETGWSLVEKQARRAASRDVFHTQGGHRCWFLEPKSICKSASPLDAIVFLDRVIELEMPETGAYLEELSAELALERLLMCRTWIPSGPETLQAFLSLLEKTSLLRLHYSSIEQATALLRQLRHRIS